MRTRLIYAGALGVMLGGCFDPEQDDTDTTATPTPTTASGSTSLGMTSTDSAMDSTGGSGSASATDEGTTTDEPSTSTGPEPTTDGTGTTEGSTDGGSSSTGVTESCDDDVLNQDESDVDCGGSICDPCDDGLLCNGPTDCASTNCDGGTCVNYCAQGCPLVGSTSANTVYVYDPDTLAQVASFAGTNSVQSVAGATGGIIYAGGSATLYEIDIAAGTVSPLGGPFLSGFLYGTTVGDSGSIYTSGSGMPDVQIIEPDGSNGGIVDVLSGSNLRSSTFGPDGSFYVSSFGGNFVERWGPGFLYDGTFSGGGLGSPFGIATRSDGTVIVASQNNAAFYVYTSVGGFLSSTPVACGGQIRNVAVDANDVLYVGCYGANRVAVFSLANVEVDSINVTQPGGVGMLYEWPGPPP